MQVVSPAGQLGVLAAAAGVRLRLGPGLAGHLCWSHLCLWSLVYMVLIASLYYLVVGTHPTWGAPSV